MHWEGIHATWNTASSDDGETSRSLWTRQWVAGNNIDLSAVRAARWGVEASGDDGQTSRLGVLRQSLRLGAGVRVVRGVEDEGRRQQRRRRPQGMLGP